MRSYFCFNRILAGVIALLLLATIFYACGKTTNDVAPSNGNDNQTIGAAANEAAVSGIYSDLFNVAVEVSASLGLSETGRMAQHKLSDKLGNCYTPEADDMTVDRWPKVVTVDFGTGCPDASGRSRAGILKLTYTGYFKYPGATVTIEPVTYAVNGISITGKKVITNQSNNELYKYGIKVTAGVIKLDTVSIGYSSNFTVIQTAGANTTDEGVDDLADDVYAFSGSDTLTYPGGLVAITNIGDSTALIRKLDCPYIGKGKAILTLKSVAATIDYGNGVCDDSAMISIGDKVKTIGLPK